MRLFMLAVLAMALFAGCTAKEFGDGVNDGVSDVKRVIRGTNN